MSDTCFVCEQPTGLHRSQEEFAQRIYANSPSIKVEVGKASKGEVAKPVLCLRPPSSSCQAKVLELLRVLA